jgi:hypothetical protein
VMLKIRGISNAEILLMGVNRFGHCLTTSISGWKKGRVFLLRKNRDAFGNPLDALVRLFH